jgi:SAM-dependent methyltransferase
MDSSGLRGMMPPDTSHANSASVAVHPRPDVERAFEPTLGRSEHILWSGFTATAPLRRGQQVSSSEIITVRRYAVSGRQVDEWRTYYCAYNEEATSTPQPPTALQERIGGSKDFISAGAQLASLVLTYVGKYKSLDRWGAVLDWGCGCARVIAQLRKLIPPGTLHGCDIDAQAITWNRDNLHGPTFTRIDPYPPAPYPDGKFDVVYGISVMTHLAEETQFLWLKELRRIARPGAILALTIIGENLRATNMPLDLAPQFERVGFAAQVPSYSDTLAEYSHDKYYQEAYHSLDYIAAHWSRYFEVLECVETKHQDIILLRRT